MQRPFTSAIPSGAGGFYGGEQGSFSRFHVDFTGGTAAAQTAYLYILHPNTNWAYSVATATSATGIVPAFTNAFGTSPGTISLAGIAQKQRGVAAAIRMAIPSLSLTTIVGEFCMGVISYDTATTATSIDQFFTLSQGRSNVTRDLHEARWYPNSFDSKYSTFSTASIAATGTDLNDTNVVFVAIRGLPASTPVSMQATTVTEWTSRPNSGLLVTSNSHSGSDHQGTVNVLNTATPGWHHTAKATGERLLEDTVGKIGKAAEKWVPKMIEGGLAAFGL
jgi:hypothetical protein